MANLNTEIKINKELRPCKVAPKGKECRGLFHGWATERNYSESYVIGIIELETGVVIKEEPECIRFVDGKVKQYFNENSINEEKQV